MRVDNALAPSRNSSASLSLSGALPSSSCSPRLMRRSIVSSQKSNRTALSMSKQASANLPVSRSL